MKSNKILIILVVLLCVSAGFMGVQLMSVAEQAKELEEQLKMASEAQIQIGHLSDAIALFIR